MSTNVITSQDAVKNAYKVFIFLVPVRVANTAAGMEKIKLKISGNKTMPGIEDGETWQFSTDDPEQEIAETIAGKFGGATPLVFEVPYDPMLIQKLTAHAATNFTVEVIYDDTFYPDIYKIAVNDCFLLSPGKSGGTGNNSSPNMTITLQPRGGGSLADCLDITKAPRS